MQIPAQYFGHWSGMINDVNRVNPYKGKITIDADGANAVYHMSHAPQSGELMPQYEADGFLAFRDEITLGWKGTVLLYLDSESNLKCVWRSGSKFSSEATMKRVESADTKQNGP